LLLLSPPVPLSLPWGEEHRDQVYLKDYRYFFGDPQWGTVVYLGKEDLLGLETEIQLEYVDRKLSSALLVLGPAGLNEINCIKRYKKVIGFLNEKYGHYRHQNITKDPLIEELVAYRPCHPVRAELYEIKTIWVIPTFRIEAELVGDEEGFYIQIEYIFLKIKRKIKQRKEKIFRSL